MGTVSPLPVGHSSDGRGLRMEELLRASLLAVLSKPLFAGMAPGGDGARPCSWVGGTS